MHLDDEYIKLVEEGAWLETKVSNTWQIPQCAMWWCAVEFYVQIGNGWWVAFNNSFKMMKHLDGKCFFLYNG